MEPARVVAGPRVTLERVAEKHAEALLGLHRTPEVRRWWRDPGEGWPFDEDDNVMYVVLLPESGDEPRGFVQYYEEDDPDYRSASIDLFLDPAIIGRGYGREVVGTLAAHLVDVRGHHRITIDPAADNAAAIACYAAVGFKPVGVLRDYERGPDGSWHDGLLMDLVARELVRP